MTKKLHRLTTYNLSLSLSSLVFVFWMFAAAAAAACLMEVILQNKAAKTKWQRNKEELLHGMERSIWMIYNFRCWFYFPLYLFAYTFSVVVVIFFHFCQFTDPWWNYHVFFFISEMIPSVYKFDFPRMPIFFFTEHCIIILPLSWWLWKWQRWRRMFENCMLLSTYTSTKSKSTRRNTSLADKIQIEK